MISPIPQRVSFDSESGPNTPWIEFLSDVFRVLRAMQGSGPTEQRPTKILWLGQPYFDTTLNKPIWFNGSNWVDATGTNV